MKKAVVPYRGGGLFIGASDRLGGAVEAFERWQKLAILSAQAVEQGVENSARFSAIARPVRIDARRTPFIGIVEKAGARPPISASNSAPSLAIPMSPELISRG